MSCLHVVVIMQVLDVHALAVLANSLSRVAALEVQRGAADPSNLLEGAGLVNDWGLGFKV
jgi:hypothetical protein